MDHDAGEGGPQDRHGGEKEEARGQGAIRAKRRPLRSLQVLLGLAIGAILWRPKALPMRYPRIARKITPKKK